MIFISIDDNEVQSLRSACDEIFGEENRVATIVWQKKDTPSNDASGMSVTHEYVLVYQRADGFERRLLPRTEEQLENYKNPDNDPRGPWTRTSLIRKEAREAGRYPVRNAAGCERLPPPGTSWRVPPERFAEYHSDKRIWWGQDGDGDLPFLKRFLSDVQEGTVPITWWSYEFAGSNRNAKIELRDLFDQEVPFDSPKPALLIDRCLQIATGHGEREIVLDFFAGSASAAHAILAANKRDGAARRFVLVQLPEPTGRGDYPTIADITKERVRRVIKNLNNEPADKLDLDETRKQDRGFRVFKLAESNFTTWDAEASPDATALGDQLKLHVDHIRLGRTADDLLYEILLKSGFPLTTPVAATAMSGRTVHAVADGKLLICLERELTLDLIRAMADTKPERVVCLDEGFAGNDQLKANAVQIFKTKGVTSFKTV